MMYMRNKKTGGLTVVELVLVLAILGVFTASFGVIMFSAVRAYADHRLIQEDQQYARLALLAMTRDAHRATDLEINTDGDVLTLTTPTGMVEYALAGGLLIRAVSAIAGVTDPPFSPVSFVPARLHSLEFEEIDEADDDGRWLNIRIVTPGEAAITLDTRISFNRILPPTP